SSPTHVAASDEVGGKAEPFLKVLQEYLDVFSGRDAAEQDNVTIGRQILRQTPHRLFERFAVLRVLLVDFDSGELAKIRKCHCRPYIDQAARRRDHEDAAISFCGRGKRIRVRDFATKIEAA